MDFRLAVKALIVREGEVLLIQRRKNDAHKPGEWDIPGGRLEVGEDPMKGLKREISEEVGLTIEPILPVDVHHFTRDDGQVITMIIFLCKAVTHEITLSPEREQFEWKSLKEPTHTFPTWLIPTMEKLRHYRLAAQLGEGPGS